MKIECLSRAQNMKSFIMYLKTLAWPAIQFWGKKFSVQQYPTATMETCLVDSLLLSLWSSSCGTHKR